MIQYATYDIIKGRVFNDRMSSLQGFFVGAFTKALATLCTYPLQVAQTRLRDNATDNSPSNST